MSDDMDKPQHECGVFALYGPNDNAGQLSFFALQTLQHRGQESAGIATAEAGATAGSYNWAARMSSGSKNSGGISTKTVSHSAGPLHLFKGMGLVSNVFNEDAMRELPGKLAIGHTRYSTAGVSTANNAQPFLLETELGPMAMAHNGQLTRQKLLRKLVLKRGTGLFTNSDSEIITQMLATNPKKASINLSGDSQGEQIVQEHKENPATVHNNHVCNTSSHTHTIQHQLNGTTGVDHSVVHASTSVPVNDDNENRAPYGESITDGCSCAALSPQILPRQHTNKRPRTMTPNAKAVAATARYPQPQMPPDMALTPTTNTGTAAAGSLFSNTFDTSPSTTRVRSRRVSIDRELEKTDGQVQIHEVKPNGYHTGGNDNNIDNRVESKEEAPMSDDPVVTGNHIIADHGDHTHSELTGWEQRLVQFMREAEGAYALTLMTPDSIYGCRDRFGLRPLCIGYRKHADGQYSYAMSSESCAYGPIGFKYLREVRPGEIIRMDHTGLHSTIAMPDLQPKIKPALCIFEYVYFARPDSMLEDQLVHSVRQRSGAQLAKEAPAEDADLVSGVPDSSIAAAVGYSAVSGLPYNEVMCKNRYIGRTFIQPDQSMRDNSIRLKFNPLAANLAGKSIVLVDDSIVRGSTMRQLIKLLRGAGARKIHVRISSPILRHPCYMGVDIGTYDEILATHVKTVEEMSKFLGADSLAFLSAEGLKSAVNKGIDYKRRSAIGHDAGHCDACFSGKYPLQHDEDQNHIGDW